MGILRGAIEDYSSPLAGLPVRLYAGYFFLKFGLAKLTGGFGGTALRETLVKWTGEGAYPFYVPFLQKVAIPHAEIFAVLVTLGECAVGAALVLGCATRLAALLGIFLCLNFAFGSGAPLLSLEQPIVFAVLFLTVYTTAAGRALGLDWILKRRLPRWMA
jgi:thiosulfate dehydrogenase [quinone] large subunit